MEPLIGAYLNETELKCRAEEQGDTVFTVVFSSGQSFAFEQFQRNTPYKTTLEQYIETILGRPARLEFEQSPAPNAAKVAQVPRGKNFIFEQDVEKYPILLILQDIFETRYISSQSAHPRPSISQENDHEYAEDAERNAENAV